VPFWGKRLTRASAEIGRKTDDDDDDDDDRVVKTPLPTFYNFESARVRVILLGKVRVCVLGFESDLGLGLD
jgi:hypothetical protein